MCVCIFSCKIQHFILTVLFLAFFTAVRLHGDHGMKQRELRDPNGGCFQAAVV